VIYVPGILSIFRLSVKGRLIIIGYIADYKSDLGFKPSRTLATIPVRVRSIFFGFGV